MDISKIHAGVIMKIIDVDSNCYFKGELDYREYIDISTGKKILASGIYQFIGKLDYKFYLNKRRHPLKLYENRRYFGKLNMVSKFDFHFEINAFEDYLIAEYDITHFRDMRVLQFSFYKQNITKEFKLPQKFKLYKSMGYSFEPKSSIEGLFNTNRPF